MHSKAPRRRPHRRPAEVTKSAARQSIAVWLCLACLLPSLTFALAALVNIAINVAAGQPVGPSDQVLGSIELISAALAPFGFVGAVIMSVFVAFSNSRDGARSPRLWMLMGIGLLLQFLIYTMLRRR
jgi:hypothetical protein